MDIIAAMQDKNMKYWTETQAEGLVQQAIAIGADGVESHIAKHQLPRKADDDVQAKGQHDVKHGRNHDVGLVKRAKQGHGQQAKGQDAGRTAPDRGV